MATQPEWIYRRVDTATLIEERRVRRRMSVDCRIPPAVVDLAQQLELDRFVVPLRFVMRRSLLSFDLELDNQPIPLLIREQNLAATQTLLAAAVEQYGIEPDEKIDAALADVANADTRAAPETLALLGLDRTDDPAAATTEANLLRWAITTFDANHLLLADVPLDSLRSRAVFKITQELTDPPTLMPRTLAQLRVRIAWDPMSIVFDAPDVTAAGSYHFQFVAPAELTVSDGALIAAGDDGEHGTPFGITVARTSVLGLNTQAKHVPDAATYRALVQVRPNPDGLLRASAVSAAASTVLLLAATLTAGRLHGSEAGASITLLLVIPGILSTFLARPGEHSLVAQALRGVRALTLLSAATVYVAAALLVLGYSGPTLRVGWSLLTALSAIPALALSVAVRRCRPAPITESQWAAAEP